MAKQTINIGLAPDDGTGDPLRTAGDKINDNFTEVYDGAIGGATVSDQLLKDWTAAESYRPARESWNGTTFIAVNVTWPDGSAGVFTPTVINSTFLEIDAFTVTHVASGKTVTQPAFTRDANGIVTNAPALTVA